MFPKAKLKLYTLSSEFNLADPVSKISHDPIKLLNSQMYRKGKGVLEHVERFVKYNTFLTFSSADGLAYKALNKVGQKLAVGRNGYRIDNPGLPQEEG